MKQKKWNKQYDKGTIMLESLIVYPVTLFLLFCILAIFSVLYQRWNLQTVANDAATRMAQTYRLTDADEITGYVSQDSLVDISLKRSFLVDFSAEDPETAINKRVSDYGGWRLQKTTFAKNIEEPKITGVVHPDAIGRKHVEVTATGKYAVPFGEFMEFFGFDGTITYEVKAYATCVDVIDYVNSVDFVKEQTNLGGDFIGLIDSVLKLLDNVLGH